MNFAELLRMSPALANALVIAFTLAVILAVSLALRARTFCQYLFEMTGIELSPGEVREVYRRKGRDGVRDLLLARTITADLAENAPSIPAGAK